MGRQNLNYSNDFELCRLANCVIFSFVGRQLQNVENHWSRSAFFNPNCSTTRIFEEKFPRPTLEILFTNLSEFSYLCIVKKTKTTTRLKFSTTRLRSSTNRLLRNADLDKIQESQWRQSQKKTEIEESCKSSKTSQKPALVD